MPVDPNAPGEVTGYSWVPDFAKGHVRDLRVRWALEEIGEPYRVRLLDPRKAHPADYLREQPFGQVPAWRDGEVELFESGAIVLHIGERSEALLPRDPQGHAKATAWVIAALNSIEPVVGQLGELDVFHAGQPWVEGRRPILLDLVRKRFAQLETYLGDRDWLEDRFTAGDLIMVAVLRTLGDSPVLAEFPKLAAYHARGEARPAFQRALAAQMADFVDG